MRRFLLLWLLLGATGGVTAAAVAWGVSRHADLRFVAFARGLLVPVIQAVVLLVVLGWRPAASLAALAPVTRSPVARTLLVLSTLLLLAAWLRPMAPPLGLHARSAPLLWGIITMQIVAAALLIPLAARRLGLSRRDQLAAAGLSMILFAAAVDIHVNWHSRLALWFPWGGPSLRAAATYGGLLILGLILALQVATGFARRDRAAGLALELAAAGAFAGALVVALNGFFRPYFEPPWTGAARTAASLAALAAILAALRALRPDASPGSKSRSRRAANPINAVVALAVITLGLPLWLLSWELAGRVGRGYGRVAYLLWPRGRRIAMINLRRAFGSSLSHDRASEMTREVFAHLGQSLAEAAQFGRRSGDGAWQDLFAVEDPELEAKILADPRPKILVTGHLGSWELGLMIPGRRVPSRAGAIARHVDNPILDRLLRRLRFDEGQWIDKRGGATAALARLEAGESVALLLDENGGHRGVFVDFFGRPASTSRLAALLALRTGAPLVIGAAVRQTVGPPFRYRLALLEPASSGATDRDTVRELTQQITRVLEGWIRETPTQWRWVHWRWKTRPDGSEERYSATELKACFAVAGDDSLGLTASREGA